MTIASQTSRIEYTGNSSTTAFSVPFYFAANADLVVYLQSTAGVSTLQTLGTNYTLTGATVSAGGTCTFTSAPTTGYTVIIYRDPALTQTTSYNNNDPFPAKSHELALDKALTIDQRSRELVTRSIHLADSEKALSTMALPAVSTRANRLLGFDSNGELLYAVGPTYVAATATGTAIVDSRATALVTTFAASVNVVITKGYTTTGDGGGASYVRGTATGGFTDGGGVAWKLDTSGGLVSPRWFGAKIDGTTDDTTALQNALNTGLRVVLPNGTTKITGTLTMTDGGSLVGAGMRSSFITSSSTTLPMISVASGVGHFTIAELCLTRSVTALSGADGILFAGNNQVCVLDRLWIEAQFNGLHLSQTAISFASNLILHANQSNGLFMTNTATLSSFQWVLDNILSELNGGRGFLIISTAGPATTNSCAQMTRLYSFANTNQGFLVTGTVAEPIAGIRLSDCFFGEDGSDEVSLDTHSGLHVLTNVFTELAGTRTTGPGVPLGGGTATSHVGSGFSFSSTNTDIEMVNCRANAHSQLGITSSCARLGIVGGSFTDNAQNGTPVPCISFGATSNNRIVGVRAGGATHNYGLAFAAAVINVLYDNCDLAGNATGTVSNASTGTVRVGQILP